MHPIVSIGRKASRERRSDQERALGRVGRAPEQFTTIYNHYRPHYRSPMSRTSALAGPSDLKGTVELLSSLVAHWNIPARDQARLQCSRLPQKPWAACIRVHENRAAQ